MRHEYRIFFNPTKTHPTRALRALVTSFPGVALDDMGDMSDNEHAIRLFFAETQRRGFACSLHVTTHYDRSDAMSAPLGFLHCGFAKRNHIGETMPKDAFDFAPGCPRCGVGAIQVKPLFMTSHAAQFKGMFESSNRSWIPLMRSEVGREIIEATRQPWCMRHPVTREGREIKEWMQAVPCPTMPPLSRKSEGVLFGSTTGIGSAGDPPTIIPPCTVCGRETWDYDY